MKAESRRLYLTGMSGIEVAEELGLPKGTVYSHLRAEPSIMRPRGETAKNKGRLRMVSEDAIHKTIELYQSGLSAYEVAEELGITHTSVIYRLRNAGVALRPRNESYKLRNLRRERGTGRPVGENPLIRSISQSTSE